jgi:hypothetical protein
VQLKKDAEIDRLGLDVDFNWSNGITAKLVRPREWRHKHNAIEYAWILSRWHLHLLEPADTQSGLMAPFNVFLHKGDLGFNFGDI